jgi:hypothetical protein
MTFDQEVKLLTYNLTYLRQITGTTTTHTQNLLQSIQAYDSGTGLKSFNNHFIAQANAPITVTSTDNGLSPVAQINAFTVEKVDLPPPATVPGPCRFWVLALPSVSAAACAVGLPFPMPRSSPPTPDISFT